MYILIAAATHNEVSSTIEWLKMNRGEVGAHEIEVLITGIGSAMASYSLTRQLLWRTPELVIQAGIAGSFNANFPPETVVLAKEEVFADLGAYSSEGFDDIFDLGLMAADEQPFDRRILVNPHTNKWHELSLPLVRGATVNNISATKHQIETISTKYGADIESMEGAALHYCCLMENVPFIQLRCISNFAGERDKRNWKIKESISLLNEKLKELINDL